MRGGWRAVIRFNHLIQKVKRGANGVTKLCRDTGLIVVVVMVVEVGKVNRPARLIPNKSSGKLIQ